MVYKLQLHKTEYDYNNIDIIMQCHGVIYMIDGSSTRDRLIESKEVLHKVLLDERIRGKPLIVLCNKNDITTCIKPEELVNILDLSKLLQDSINNGLVTHIITRVVRSLLIYYYLSIL